jgi:biofilm PGA synthesis lipoprotein PgaB
MAFKPVIFAVFLSLVSGYSFAANEFIALCYHDIRDDVDGVVDDDQMAVSTDNLIAQFSWLREHDYHVISLDDVLAARRGTKQLPENAVLLTFDDGYKSIYTHVFPLLKQFNYPAVVALVGKWLETPSGQPVIYGGKETKPRSFFMNKEEIREIQKSGLIEYASHSYNLHQGILGNPQGNKLPAATTFQYIKNKEKYETLNRYKKRISTDLQRNNKYIQRLTGVKPRTIVWPYGSFSRLSESIANRLGLNFSLTLEDGINKASKSRSIKRMLIQGNPPLNDFVYALRHPLSQEPIRVAHVDLDLIYDPDPTQENRNLSQLLDRIKSMSINTVFLQAFADPDGDGNADALYFPNRHLPVRRDLFNRVAWQLKTRSKVNIYAWMPVLSFLIPGTEKMRVHHLKDDDISPVRSEYLRLSPFNEDARILIEEIYEDLAMHASFSGLIFHDDAYLNDFEDFSPEALRYTSVIFKKPNLAVEDLTGSLSDKWNELKIHELTQFTLQLANRVKWYRPEIKTARNIYANVLLMPKSQEWFSQTYPDMLHNYDYTAVMAMPYMEQAEKPEQWLSKLVNKVSLLDPKFNKTLFELQSVDWRTNKPVSRHVMEKHFRLLMRSGAHHIGYYPDNFLNNSPSLVMVKSNLSLKTFPFGQ